MLLGQDVELLGLYMENNSHQVHDSLAWSSQCSEPKGQPNRGNREHKGDKGGLVGAILMYPISPQ